MNCREFEFYFDSGYSLFNYNGFGRELLYQYKFRNSRNLSVFIAEEIYKYIIESEKILPVVPVPSRKKSVMKRGWDPVNLILKELNNRFGLKGLKLLKRLPSKAQKDLDREERGENIRNKIKFIGEIIPEAVFLLDDVWTTGATVNECSIILKKAGCREVNVITICRD